MENSIINWIQRISEQEVIPSNIIAFNLGLFKSEEGYCIYMIGSQQYDETDDDWACDDDYEPKEKYFKNIRYISK